MRNKFVYVVWIFCTLFILQCSKVPLTGRRQVNLIPNSQMLSMSFQQYNDFIKGQKLSSDQSKVQMVKTVGSKIQSAVERYFAENKMSDQIKGYQWEYSLVESNEVNAFCMPGGKVVVYTGILPVTQDETGLAVVLGHEISHAIAEHGNERMSQALIQQLGGIALAEALKTKSQATQQLAMAAYGAGSTVGILLPFSRTQESEADRLGLIFMSMAGYDPNLAVSFWQRMSQSSKGQKPPEFLSTHPSDETRIKQIQKEVPEAMKYYKK